MSGSLQWSQVYGTGNVSEAKLAHPPESNIASASSPLVGNHAAMIALAAMIAVLVGLRIMYSTAVEV